MIHEEDKILVILGGVEGIGKLDEDRIFAREVYLELKKQYH